MTQNVMILVTWRHEPTVMYYTMLRRYVYDVVNWVLAGCMFHLACHIYLTILSLENVAYSCMTPPSLVCVMNMRNNAQNT